MHVSATKQVRKIHSAYALTLRQSVWLYSNQTRARILKKTNKNFIPKSWQWQQKKNAPSFAGRRLCCAEARVCQRQERGKRALKCLANVGCSRTKGKVMGQQIQDNTFISVCGAGGGWSEWKIWIWIHNKRFSVHPDHRRTHASPYTSLIRSPFRPCTMASVASKRCHLPVHASHREGEKSGRTTKNRKRFDFNKNRFADDI